RLATAEVAERRRMLEVADADGACLGDSWLDPVPGGMLQVEGEPQRRVERAEQQLEHPLVARPFQRDPHRTETVAEPTHTALELGDDARPLARKLGRELEPVGHLLRPAPELLLAREPVSGRVQLDRREALGIEGEEAARIEPGRVEAGPPARIRPAR